MVQAEDSPDIGSRLIATDLPPAPIEIANRPIPGVEVDDHFSAELSELQKRIASLESSQKKRSADEAAKKVADAKKPTVKWSGELQADSYLFNQNQESLAAYGDIENGTAFRRARMAMFGDYGPTEYRIEMDFAQSSRPSFLDVFAGVRDVPVLGRVRAGHFFEPFLLDRMTSNRYVTFMERASPDQAFAPARNLGIGANNTYLEERGTWSLGLFRTDSDNNGDDAGDRFEKSVTGRLTYLPYYDEASGGAHYLHLGTAFSYRQTNNRTARFRSQPEAREGALFQNVPFFVDTGEIAADTYQLIGLESAWIHGPFSLQGEYVLTPVQTDEGGTVTLQGWYLQTSYFLTGEHRPYRRDLAAFDRVIPHCEAIRYTDDKKLQKGPGAWEIALRVSQLDLNDGFVQGGRLTDITAGLNWYLTPYSRLTFNYVHAFSDIAIQKGMETDIFSARVGYEF